MAVPQSIGSSPASPIFFTCIYIYIYIEPSILFSTPLLLNYYFVTKLLLTLSSGTVIQLQTIGSHQRVI